MRYLLLLMVTILYSCGHPEEANTKYVKERGYKLVEENSQWKVYQVNDSCLLAVPNYNNKKDKPSILKVK